MDWVTATHGVRGRKAASTDPDLALMNLASFIAAQMSLAALPAGGR